ncbi:MAG: NAD(P)-dependent oxidoreductase [Patescibacteria group bacterium]
MSVLILGGQGNLGTQLSRIFSGSLAWDREDLDFLNFPLLEEKIGQLRPEVIINAVAYNAVDKCEQDSEELDLAYKLNRDLPESLARIAIAIGATLLHYSSDYVFSGDLNKPKFKEDDPVNPVNKYGASKAAGEEAIRRIAAESSLSYFIIRTSKLFGPRGASPLSKSSFFDIMLDLAQNKEEIKVVDEESSCFTYTPDLARATQALLQSPHPAGIYHITNSQAANWFEAAQTLFEIKGLNPRLIAIKGADLNRPARRPLYSILENNNLPNLRAWPEALKEYLNL